MLATLPVAVRRGLFIGLAVVSVWLERTLPALSGNVLVDVPVRLGLLGGLLLVAFAGFDLDRRRHR